MFEHKGYQGGIDDADTQTGWFHGSIVGIQDVVTFDGKTVPELQKAFQESVDDYLEFCDDLKEPPEKPFSGKHVVHFTPELHRRACGAATQEQVSLNTWIVAAIEAALRQWPTRLARLSFEDLDQLANSVAAILAETKRQPARSTPDASTASPRKGSGGRPRRKITL